MNILILTIPASLFLVFGFILSFLWASRSGQWDDLDTPSHKILTDDSTELVHEVSTNE